MSNNKVLHRGVYRKWFGKHRPSGDITENHVDAILDALEVARLFDYKICKPKFKRRQYTVALHAFEMCVNGWRKEKESKKLKKPKTIATFDRKTGKLVLNKGVDEIALWRDLFRDLQNMGFKNENNK